MALAAITVYTPQPTTNFHVVIVSLIFGAINLPSISVWLVLGVQMRRFLTTDKRFRACEMAPNLSTSWPAKLIPARKILA